MSHRRDNLDCSIGSWTTASSHQTMRAPGSVSGATTGLLVKDGLQRVGSWTSVVPGTTVEATEGRPAVLVADSLRRIGSWTIAAGD